MTLAFLQQAAPGPGGLGQTLTGFLPIILVFIWRLARNREILGEDRNRRGFEALAIGTVVWTSTLSIVLLIATATGHA